MKSAVGVVGWCHIRIRWGDPDTKHRFTPLTAYKCCHRQLAKIPHNTPDVMIVPKEKWFYGKT